MGTQIWPAAIGGVVSLLLALISLYASGKWGRWKRRAERAEAQSRIDQQTAWYVEQLQQDNQNLRVLVTQLQEQAARHRRRAP